MNTPASRVIHLRRPAVLQSAVSAWVPPGVADACDRERVELRWSELCAQNPRYFDGRILHVLGVHRNGYGGAVIHTAETAYRYFAVRSPDFDPGVHPLGAKGIVFCGDRVLIGRRSSWVAGYPGEWEFVPGGTVEPDEDPGATVRRELREEAGAAVANATRSVLPIAVVFDDALQCWEVVHRIELDADAPGLAEITALPGATTGVSGEYEEYRWVHPKDLPTSMTSVAKVMIPLCGAGDSERTAD